MLTIRRCAGCGKEFDAEVGTPDRVCFACRDVLGDWDGAGSEEKIRDEGIRNRARGDMGGTSTANGARGRAKSNSIDKALRSLSRGVSKEKVSVTAQYRRVLLSCAKPIKWR